MKKLALALLATAALSMPAMAASDTNQQTQYPQDQQSQAQNTNEQAQPNNTYNQVQPNNANQAQNQQNQENNQQTISPDKLSRHQVQQIQQALDKNGFQVGRVDGRWGPKTDDAVKQFQQSKNIQSNGQLDQQTLSDLGLNGAQFAQQNEGNASQGR
jgi:DNA polymerase sigma